MFEVYGGKLFENKKEAWGNRIWKKREIPGIISASSLRLLDSQNGKGDCAKEKGTRRMNK